MIVGDSVREPLRDMARHIGIDPDTVARVSEGDLFAGLRKTITDHCDVLLPRAAELMGLTKGDLETRFVGAEVSRHVAINAETLWSWNERFSITIYYPMMSFIWNMAKLWATRVGVMTSPGHMGEDTALSFAETVGLADELMRAFWGNEIHCNQYPSVTRLSQAQIAFASNLLHFGERFVVAHEFGHAVLRWATGSAREPVANLLDRMRPWAHLYVHEILKVLPDYPKESAAAGWGQNEFVRRWTEEFAADAIGMKLTVSLATNDRERAYALWASETIFVMMDLLEASHPRIRGSLLPLTGHPFGKLGLSLLRSLARDTCNPEMLSVGRAFEQFGDEIMLALGVRNPMGSS